MYTGFGNAGVDSAHGQGPEKQPFILALIYKELDAASKLAFLGTSRTPFGGRHV
jgi:hypothetical protein